MIKSLIVKCLKQSFLAILLIFSSTNIFGYPTFEDIRDFSFFDILLGIPFLISLYLVNFIVVYITVFVSLINKIALKESIFQKAFFISKKIIGTVFLISWVMFLFTSIFISVLWGIIIYMMLGINRLDIFLIVMIIIYLIFILISSIKELKDFDLMEIKGD